MSRLNDFLETKNFSKQAEKTLNSTINYNRGTIIKLYELVENKVSQYGNCMQIKEYRPALSEKKYNDIQACRSFNLYVYQENLQAKKLWTTACKNSKRLKELMARRVTTDITEFTRLVVELNKKTVREYRFYDSDGSFVELPKIAYEYGKFLIKEN